MKIGFIGFGGAAYGLAKGLRQEGLTGIYYFDALWDTQPNSDVILRHATETGAVFTKSIAALIEEVEIVVSCVTGSVALLVAKEAASYLEKHHLFVDVNTASPKTMEVVGDVIQKSGTDFVDVAMLGGIPAFLHRVPSLASGSGAERMSHEMAEVIATYAEMGLPSTMSAATREKLKWCSEMKLADHFGGDMPDSLDEILDVMEERSR